MKPNVTVKRRFIYLSIIIVFFLVLLEIGLRIFRYYFDPMRESQLENTVEPDMGILKFDPILDHTWKPNLNFIDKNRSIPYLLKTNRQTWVEDYDVELKKSKDTYRIFYVGDSNVQGVVEKQFKMVELVKKGLNERFGKQIHFEVINTGTSSYSTIIYYLLVKYRLLEYSPDLVVLNIDMSDIPNDNAYERGITWNTQGEPTGFYIPEVRSRSRIILTPRGYIDIGERSKIWDWFVKHLALADYMDESIIRIKCRNIQISFEIPQVEAQGEADWLSLNWTEAVHKNVKESMRLLTLLIRLLKEKGVKVMVTGVPFLHQFTGELSSRPHEELRETCIKEKIPFLDSYQELKKRTNPSEISRYYWTEDPTHFNIEGNQLWAQIQLDFLLNENNNLLPFDELKRK